MIPVRPRLLFKAFRKMWRFDCPRLTSSYVTEEELFIWGLLNSPDKVQIHFRLCSAGKHYYMGWFSLFIVEIYLPPIFAISLADQLYEEFGSKVLKTRTGGYLSKKIGR